MSLGGNEDELFEKMETGGDRDGDGGLGIMQL